MDELKLGVVETKFAELVWANAPISSGDLVKLCAKELEWKKSTCYTVLKKLEAKGFVRTEKQGNRNLYTPLVRRVTYCGAVTAAQLATLYGGDIRRLVEALADTGRLSNGKMEQLARWLDNRVVEHPEYDYD